MKKIIVKIGKKRAVDYIKKLQVIRWQFERFNSDIYDDIEAYFNVAGKYIAEELGITEDEACVMLANNQIEFKVELGYLTTKAREKIKADKERKAEKKMAEFDAMPYI